MTIYKDDDDSLVSNYRPISILSTLGKVLKDLICPHIQKHFRCFLTDTQHGFVRSRSTSTNLATYTESLVCAVDNRLQVDAIYTDFSKAFDKVSHQMLLQKLSVYGFDGALLSWLSSYLKDRTF